MVNAIDGIVKIEQLALTAEEREDGLETSIVLLNSIQQRTSRKVAIVIFNVKGKDLLSIDKPNESRCEWIALSPRGMGKRRALGN